MSVYIVIYCYKETTYLLTYLKKLKNILNKLLISVCLLKYIDTCIDEFNIQEKKNILSSLNFHGKLHAFYDV